MSDATPFIGGSSRGAGSAPVIATPAAVVDGPAAATQSAGSLIRQARQAQGLHVSAMAAAIKVSQHKLELLEADRIDQLPDATFARALAQTVCRFLKIDPQPVLAQLPRQGGYRLEDLSDGINMPFRERPGRREPGDWSVLGKPAVWGPALLLLAAAALYAAPAGWLGAWPDWASRWARRSTATEVAGPTGGTLLDADGSPGAATAAGDRAADTAALPSTVAEAPQRVAANVPSAAPATPAATAAQLGAPRSAALPSAVGAGNAGAAALGVDSAGPTLQLRANAESWVEVIDSRAQVLLARTLRPGETVSLEGSMPLRLKVGNAAGTEAVFRGRTLDLPGSTRDNVARLELK